MSRFKGKAWEMPDPIESWDQAAIAVLMDLRDELLEIKDWLRQIGLNTAQVADSLDDPLAAPRPVRKAKKKGRK